MRNNLLRSFFTFLLTITVLLTVQANNHFQQQRDSITQRISTLQGEEKLDAYQELFDLLETDTISDASVQEYLNLSDVFTAEAQKQGNAKECGRNMINRALYLANNKRWKELDERKNEYLDYTFKNELWDYYYAIQSVYLENYYLKTGQMDRVIREANELYAKAKAEKHSEGIMTSRFVMARAFNSQRRYAEAETYFEEGLKAYSKEKTTPAYLDGWNNYCALLVDTRQWEKALSAIGQFDEITCKFLKDIGRSYPYLEAVILRLYAHTYTGTNQLEKAKAALDNADLLSNDLIGLTNSNSIRAEIAVKQGKYSEALSYLTKVKELRSGKTDYIDVTILQTKASIWAKIEKAENTLLWSEKAFKLADSLSQNEFNRQLDELRTVYEVDVLTEEKDKIHLRWIAATLLSLLLMALLVVIILYSRRMKQKNQALYLQIQELTRKEKTIEKCLFTSPEESLSKEMLLFRRLSQLMQTDKPFTDSQLTRKKLAYTIGTNETYLAEAIKQSTGHTFTSYISNLRLLYAVELLTKNKEITLDAVAIDSGHGSYSPFYRSFTKKYGITPSEYRKLSHVTTH